MKLQYCPHLILLGLLPIINADKSVDIHQLHENVDIDSQSILNLLGINSSITMDNLNTLNIRSLLNGLSFNSVLKEILNTTTGIPIPNVSPRCMAVGMELLAPLKNVTDLKKIIQILLASPAGKSKLNISYFYL